MYKLTTVSIAYLNQLCKYTDQELYIKMKANGGINVDLTRVF